MKFRFLFSGIGMLMTFCFYAQDKKSFCTSTLPFNKETVLKIFSAIADTSICDTYYSTICLEGQMGDGVADLDHNYNDLQVWLPMASTKTYDKAIKKVNILKATLNDMKPVGWFTCDFHDKDGGFWGFTDKKVSNVEAFYINKDHTQDRFFGIGFLKEKKGYSVFYAFYSRLNEFPNIIFLPSYKDVDPFDRLFQIASALKDSSIRRERQKYGDWKTTISLPDFIDSRCNYMNSGNGERYAYADYSTYFPGENADSLCIDYFDFLKKIFHKYKLADWKEETVIEESGLWSYILTISKERRIMVRRYRNTIDLYVETWF